MKKYLFMSRSLYAVVKTMAHRGVGLLGFLFLVSIYNLSADQSNESKILTAIEEYGNTGEIHHFLEIKRILEDGFTTSQSLQLLDMRKGRYAGLLHYALNGKDYRNERVKSRLDVIALLILHGADVNQLNLENDSPLLVAVNQVCTFKSGECISIVKLLLEAGADVNWQHNRSGLTILMRAIYTESKELFRLFFKYESNLEAEDLSGHTVDYYARGGSGYPKIIEEDETLDSWCSKGLNMPVLRRVLFIKLKRNQKKKVDLSFFRISDEDFMRLEEALEENSSLKVLKLRSIMNDKALELALMVLRTSFSIEELDISHNNIGIGEILEIIRVSQQHNSLKKLNISFNGISADEAQVIAEAIAEANSSIILKHIEL